jgi:RimJ/RimL family protein N-acetyltransferase
MAATALEMVPAEAGFLRNLLENPALAPFLRQAAEGTLVHQARTGAPAPWTGYLAREGSDWVGVCAFVDRPRDGEVEIAYGTVPGHEGRGIASAMAAWLIGRAFEEREVAAVTANTAPEHNASTRILRKHGFVRDGVIQDAEIGEAWHWRKPRG